MATPSSLTHHSGDTQAWESLRRAIATSSGFQRWRQQTDQEIGNEELSSEELVIRYLRETLETLAY